MVHSGSCFTYRIKNPAQWRGLVFDAVELGRLPTLTKPKQSDNASAEEMASILDRYVKRWQRWAVSGLQGITIELYGDAQYPIQRDLLRIVR